MNPLSLLDICKTLIEVAGLALLGQGVLYLLAGARRDQNIVYQILAILTRPVFQVTRLISPRVILDRHLGYLVFLLLLLAWFFILGQKQGLCLADLRHPGCARLAAEYVKRCEAGQEPACQVLARNHLAGERTPVPTPAQESGR